MLVAYLLTSFFLNRSGYQDALNVLLVALRSGEGFVKVVGEVGTAEVARHFRLPASYFGEGLARVADRLVQLTWREGVALVWDRERDRRFLQDLGLASWVA